MSNREILQRSLQAVWHPCTQMKLHEWLPLTPIARGQGVWLYDFDGRRYLDAISSWWVNLFGHANPRINQALKDQLDRLEHVILAGYTHEPVVQLSEQLSALTDGNLGHCLYASDGSSAVEIALKLSHHYWRNLGREQKCEFVCLQGGYHGETTGTLSVSDVGLYKDAYAPLLRFSHTVPPPDTRAAESGETAEQFALRCAQVLEDCLAKHHQRIAAVIVEPLVQCASGMAMYHPAYLRAAREICDRYEVHLIADEIAVGFGRTGSMLACQQAGIWPDIMCLAKGLTGGYLPLSVTLSKAHIYQAFYDDSLLRGFLHSHSHTGNALACRAALATLAIFRDDHVLSANADKAQRISAHCAVLRAHPRVSNFRHCGMIWAFEVETSDAHFPRRVTQAALAQELLLRPIGNTVYFMPPYVIDDAEAQHLVKATGAVLDQLAT